MVSIKIVPNQGKAPIGQLATAEIHFTEGEEAAGDELLAGLKLIGFAIWERSMPGGLSAGHDRATRRNVTFPARQYSINGERRSFALLRPVREMDSQARVRDAILAAYADYEKTLDIK